MILALLLAAAQALPTAAWIADRWVPAAEADRRGAGMCWGEIAKRWRDDGSYAAIAGWGTWRLNGDRLIERADGADGTPGARAPRISRVQRLGADRMRLIDAAGRAVEWRRCR